MAQVVVTIAGRVYRMNCEDGQESHIERLAFDIDAKMNELRASFGEIGEQRLTVMAALTIADDFSSAQKRIAALEDEIASLRNASSSVHSDAISHNAHLMQALASATDRIEQIAKDLGPARA